MSSEWATFIFLLLVILATIDVVRRAARAVLRDRQEEREQKAMRRLARRRQPWVTVLIYASGQDAALKETIRSVKRSKYKSYDVVVAEASADSKKHSFKMAYRNSKKGKFVVLLTAGERIDPHTLKRAVVSRHGRSRWRVAAHLQEPMQSGVMGVVSQLQETIWQGPPSVEVTIPQALRKGKVHPPLGVREELTVLASIALGVVVLLSAYAGGVVIWYVWVLFSGYLFALIWLHWGTFPRLGILLLSIPSALFLIPITAFFKEISQLSTRK